MRYSSKHMLSEIDRMHTEEDFRNFIAEYFVEHNDEFEKVLQKMAKIKAKKIANDALEAKRARFQQRLNELRGKDQ